MARATEPASSRLETQAQSPTPCSQGTSWHRDPCPPRTLTSAGPAGPGALPRTTSCRSVSLSPCGGRSARGQPAPSFPLAEAGPGAQRTCVSRADSLPHTASHSGGHEAFAGRLRSPRAEGGTRLEQGGRPARTPAIQSRSGPLPSFWNPGRPALSRPGGSPASVGAPFPPRSGVQVSAVPYIPRHVFQLTPSPPSHGLKTRPVLRGLTCRPRRPSLDGDVLRARTAAPLPTSGKRRAGAPGGECSGEPQGAGAGTGRPGAPRRPSARPTASVASCDPQQPPPRAVGRQVGSAKGYGVSRDPPGSLHWVPAGLGSPESCSALGQVFTSFVHSISI